MIQVVRPDDTPFLRTFPILPSPVRKDSLIPPKIMY